MRDPDTIHPLPPADPVEPRSIDQAYGRTWELELLLSGAVTFALLQLPSAVDRWFWRINATSAGMVEEAAEMGYVYVKLILYALIAGFLLHLATRAYWVGLIGLDSVFPLGVRWERLRYGPITEAVYRERQPALRTLIGRVDRFCSIIFAFAFQLVLIFIASILLGATAGVLALAVARLFTGGEHVGTIFQFVFWTPLVMATVVPLVDRAVGSRLDPDGRAARLLRRAIRISYRLILGTAVIPPLNVLLSNFRKGVVNGVAVAAIVGLFAFFSIKDMAIPRGIIRSDAYEFLPVQMGGRGVDPRHYDELRPPWAGEEPLPSIQADMIRDPFVRLFLPYLPDRHNVVIRERCPGVAPLQAPGLRIVGRRPAPPSSAESDQVLGCLARLQPVQLNGTPLDDLRFRFFTHPESGLRGIVAYLPTSAMPEGENLLEVAPLPEPVADGVAGDRVLAPHFIPFWVGR